MEETSWDLEQILKLKEFEKALNQAYKDLEIFPALFTELSTHKSVASYQKFISNYETLISKLNILLVRTLLLEETDQTNTKAKFLKGKVENLIVAFENTTRPIWLWLKGKQIEQNQILNEQQAKILFHSIPRLEYYTNRERRLAKHNLDNKAESIILRKDLVGLDSLLEIRSQIETEQRYVVKINGNLKTFKTIADLNRLFQSPVRKTRINAYNALLKEYERNLGKYAIIYDSVVKDWNYEFIDRKYTSAINVRNVENDLPDEIITELLAVTKSNTKIFEPFFKWKARHLHLNKLTRYDLYAPFSKVHEPKIPFIDAKRTVLSVLAHADPEFFALAESLFSKKHLDVFPDPKKSSGGFCMTFSTTISPYILLNYTGTKQDVKTLAHELGHGIHGIYASEQSILTLDAPLVLAETASTLSEMLVFDHLLSQAKSNKEKEELLAEKISDIYATIVKQVFLVLFELEAHDRIPEGLKLEDLNELYLQNLKQQFGKAVKVPDIFKYEWAYIPHIVRSPFYCYSYAFGELLALALYHEYKIQGKTYLKKIKTILKAGGAMDPVELLESVGINIKSGTFWQEGFDLVKILINELLELSPTS